MGVLDDAIREHLELKRRRGADPTEIERAEREALGPVRRMPEPGEAPGDEQVLVDQELDYEFGPEGEFDDDEYDAPGSPAYDEPRAGYDEPRGVYDDEPDGYEDPPGGRADPHAGYHEPAPAPAEPGGGPLWPEDDGWEEDPLPAGPETAEYHAVGEFDRPAEPGNQAADEILEETPEFLQDTPDHDRLWFEQRPPKDFDFDG